MIQTRIKIDTVDATDLVIINALSFTIKNIGTNSIIISRQAYSSELVNPNPWVIIDSISVDDDAFTFTSFPNSVLENIKVDCSTNVGAKARVIQTKPIIY